MQEPIAPFIRAEILRRLRKVEQEEDVQILFAIESGSRAWGFASPNSDYDVRFVYRHRKEWYLSIQEQRDVIERDIVDDIDLNGWDLRKALQLLRKSNPAMIEWLHSPIVYRANESMQENLLALMPSVYSSERGIQHYRSMAKTNYREYLDNVVVPLKKYFYVLRPLFAVRWIEQYQSAPPIEFERLLAVIEGQADLIKDIYGLLREKRAATEKTFVPRRALLNNFIEAELARLAQRETGDTERPDSVLQLLNQVFRNTIDLPWPSVATDTPTP